MGQGSCRLNSYTLKLKKKEHLLQLHAHACSFMSDLPVAIRMTDYARTSVNHILHNVQKHLAVNSNFPDATTLCLAPSPSLISMAKPLSSMCALLTANPSALLHFQLCRQGKSFSTAASLLHHKLRASLAGAALGRHPLDLLACAQ